MLETIPPRFFLRNTIHIVAGQYAYGLMCT